MRVVIDTNVVISAVLKDRDPEAVLRFVVGHAHYEWIASREILAEYSGVLRRPKFRLPETLLQEWTALLHTAINLVDVEITVDFPRDQKDAKFLACALAADADYLITGDRDLIEAYRLLNTTVCSLNQFKRLVIDRESN